MRIQIASDHWCVDYQVGKCCVIRNLRGRPGRNRTNPAIAYENADFNAALTVEI